MFGIFKKKEVKPDVVSIENLQATTESKEQINTITKPALKTYTQKELVEQIHKSFYTEVDKLLEFSNIKKEYDHVDNHNIDHSLLKKRDDLLDLGFVSSKTYLDSESEQDKVKNIERKNKQTKYENKQREFLKETILYFKNKYPFYKFITEESVKKICSKYNLIYGSVDRYIGDIPEKNIEEMKRFKINDDDCCYIASFYRHSDNCSHKEEYYPYEFIRKINISKKKHDETEEDLSRPKEINSGTIHSKYITSKSKLEIAAPIKEFNMTGSEIEGFELKSKLPEIQDDPIVLQPVYHNNKKHYLIVTAWGLEASDEMVVNEKMN